MSAEDGIFGDEIFGCSPAIPYEALLSKSTFLHSVLTNSTESGGCIPPTASRSLAESSANEIPTLNALIIGLLDNIDEHRRAIFATEQRLDWMQRRLYGRVQAVEQLQAYVEGLGAQPATTRSALAAAVALKLADRPRLTNDEQELINDAERGERNLRRQIDKCFSGGRLSESGRRCLSELLKAMDGNASKAKASLGAQTGFTNNSRRSTNE